MFNDVYNGLTLDEAAEKAGGYVEYYPGKKIIVEHDYRAAIDYCREKGIETTEMTDSEWEMFEFKKPLVSTRQRESVGV